jgi:hypothetical protein
MRPTDYISHIIGILNPLEGVPWRVGKTVLDLFHCLRVVVFTFNPLANVNKPKALFGCVGIIGYLCEEIGYTTGTGVRRTLGLTSMAWVVTGLSKVLSQYKHFWT